MFVLEKKKTPPLGKDNGFFPRFTDDMFGKALNRLKRLNHPRVYPGTFKGDEKTRPPCGSLEGRFTSQDQ